MEMFGNCSHTNEQDFMRQSLHMAQAHWTNSGLTTTQSCSFSHTSSHSSSRSSHSQTLCLPSHSINDRSVHLFIYLVIGILFLYFSEDHLPYIPPSRHCHHRPVTVPSYPLFHPSRGRASLHPSLLHLHQPPSLICKSLKVPVWPHLPTRWKAFLIY